MIEHSTNLPYTFFLCAGADLYVDYPLVSQNRLSPSVMYPHKNNLY